MLDTLALTPLTVSLLLGPDPEVVPVAVGSGDHHELAELVRSPWQRPEDTQAVAALDDRLLVGLLRPARVYPLVQHLTDRPAQPEPEVNHFPRPPALPLGRSSPARGTPAESSQGLRRPARPRVQRPPRGVVAEWVYLDVFHAARATAFTDPEAVSLLARRPYDLRHAAVSTWLSAGVAPAQVAEWAGHTVEVLLRVYAKCIAGQQDEAKRRIEEATRPLEVDGVDERDGDSRLADPST